MKQRFNDLCENDHGMKQRWQIVEKKNDYQ